MACALARALLLLAMILSCAPTPALALGRRRHPLSYAQAEEDVFLFESYFWGKKRGVILESGALDGVRFSTSLFFERAHKWTAVHVEPSPINFRRLQKHRPRSTNVQAALCNSSGTMHFLDGKNNSSGGRATTALAEHMTLQFAESFHPEFAALLKEGQGVTEQSMALLRSKGVHVHEVPCTRISDLLLNISVPHVDIWVLDVEGAELSALQGMNFSAVSVSVIMLEVPRGRDSAALTYLTQQANYSCVPFRHNQACHHESFTPSVSLKSSLVTPL